MELYIFAIIIIFLLLLSSPKAPVFILSTTSILVLLIILKLSKNLFKSKIEKFRSKIRRRKKKINDSIENTENKNRLLSKEEFLKQNFNYKNKQEPTCNKHKIYKTISNLEDKIDEMDYEIYKQKKYKGMYKWYLNTVLKGKRNAKKNARKAMAEYAKATQNRLGNAEKEMRYFRHTGFTVFVLFHSIIPLLI